MMRGTPSSRGSFMSAVKKPVPSSPLPMFSWRSLQSKSAGTGASLFTDASGSGPHFRHYVLHPPKMADVWSGRTVPECCRHGTCGCMHGKTPQWMQRAAQLGLLLTSMGVPYRLLT